MVSLNEQETKRVAALENMKILASATRLSPSGKLFVTAPSESTNDVIGSLKCFGATKINVVRETEDNTILEVKPENGAQAVADALRAKGVNFVGSQLDTARSQKP